MEEANVKNVYVGGNRKNSLINQNFRFLVVYRRSDVVGMCRSFLILS